MNLIAGMPAQLSVLFLVAMYVAQPLPQSNAPTAAIDLF
jgi:hypothetical protein